MKTINMLQMVTLIEICSYDRLERFLSMDARVLKEAETLQNSGFSGYR